MIPARYVKSYMAAPREDHRWLKRVARSQVEAALAALSPEPALNPGLHLHQKVGVLLGIAYPAFAFWYDMGSGKTLLALELLRYWWRGKRVRRALILVTSDKAFPTWEKQIKQFGIRLPYVILSGSSVEKWHTLRRFGDGLIIATYPGLVAATTRAERKGRKRKRGWVIDAAKVAKLAGRLDALVLDESTKVGHHTSLAYQLCLKLAATAHIRYALAGRPFGRDPTMLWAQHNIVDGGETFGPTLGLFRAAFFHESLNPWDRKGRARNYEFNRRRMPALMRMARHRSLTYSAEECIDLPDFVPIREEVLLPEEAQAYYRRVVDEVIAARGNLQEMKNAFIRMRQLSSGFLGFRNEESGERAEIAFQENPKLDRLLELLDDLPRNRKAVVFFEFTHSGRAIYHALKARGQRAVWLWGGTKDPAAALARFIEDPEVEVAVVQHKVGAYSIDGLQVANYVMFYESPVSVIDREQAERRLRRQGQKRKVMQYDLVVKDTLDVRILDFHKEGGDLLAALRADPRALFPDH